VTRRGTRGKVLLGAGIALVVAGVAILGYVGWELYGTTWLSKREQSKVVGATERVWGDPGKPASKEDRELAEDVVALVRIPAFGDSYVVPAHEGTGDDVLARGFGVFEDSADPGGVGNFALAGHRITHGEPLRHLPDLRAGDTVVVETADTTYTYVLDGDGDALSVGMDAGWVTASDPVNPETGEHAADVADSRRLLTLVTCAELFHTDERLVVFGHLVSADPSGG
jgi:sortase A